MPLTHRRRKEIASLARKKGRMQVQQFLVEGLRLVEAALDAKADLTEVLIATQVQSDERVLALLHRVASESTTPLIIVPEDTFAALSAVETSQGILAVATMKTVPLADLASKQRLLVLDAVQDPGNVGTLLRTAAWFGIDAVLAGTGTADFFNPKVVRSAMGGLWDVDLAVGASLPALLKRWKEQGIRLYGADLDGTPVRHWQPVTPSALVMGSEAHGLSEEVQALLQERVTITGTPQRRGAESLNVAVAGGILMQAWAA